MPDRNRNRVGGQPDFEIAYYTKELGKSLQRKMLQHQLAQLSKQQPSNDPAGAAAGHGEAASPQPDDALPDEDRAG